MSHQPIAALAPLPASTIAAAQRARMIYREAQSTAAAQLWEAVLGGQEQQASGSVRPDTRVRETLSQRGDPLMAALIGAAKVSAGAIGNPAGEAARRDPPPRRSPPSEPVKRASGLGANQAYAPLLSAAAARTGVPAPTIAAIVGAEAAKTRDGRWVTTSRNPRSSAVGLGQFLARTWIGEAERAGTWLHQLALDKGWLAPNGSVRGEARAALLAMRSDAQTAIEAVADYAHHNLAQLRAATAATDDRIETVTRMAYVAHHLGVSDALHFLRGALDPRRATRLLVAQIGANAAAQRIARSGDPILAHRSWLADLISRVVNPLELHVTTSG